jgi:FkbM family methyltransferase
VAFEPSTEAFKQLSARFQNHPNITLVNSALGSRRGQAELYFDKVGSGLGSLSQRNLNHLKVPFEEFEVISIITAQNWIEENLITPTFVKIDVEGHELDVLLGFGDYLESIKLIQFEFGGCNVDSRTFFKDFWILLNQKFEIYRISPNGPHLITEYTEVNESFMTSNFLALRKS